MDISQKKTNGCPTGPSKDARCHSSSGKCKWKPQWAATSHLLEWLLWKRQKVTSVYKEVGRGPLYAVGEKVSCCRCYDTVGRVPNTSETEPPQTQCSHFWEHMQSKRNQCLAVMSAVLCSLQGHSQWPRRGSQPVSATVKCIKGMWYMCEGISFSFKNKGISSFVTTWLSLEEIMWRKVSQTLNDKCCMISLLCGVSESDSRSRA